MQFLHNCSSANHIPKELPKSWEKEKNEKCLHACFCQIRLWGLLYSSQLLHSSYFLSWFFVSGMKMKFILLRDVSFVIVNVFQNCNILVGFCSVVLSDVIWKLFLLHFSSWKQVWVSNIETLISYSEKRKTCVYACFLPCWEILAFIFLFLYSVKYIFILYKVLVYNQV
jgi:hypothetical protein